MPVLYQGSTSEQCKHSQSLLIKFNKVSICMVTYLVTAFLVVGKGHVLYLGSWGRHFAPVKSKRHCRVGLTTYTVVAPSQHKYNACWKARTTGITLQTAQTKARSISGGQTSIKTLHSMRWSKHTRSKPRTIANSEGLIVCHAS